jgi:hypothetical protein
MEAGQQKLKALRALQARNYVADLAKATFFRKPLNSRLQELVD